MACKSDETGLDETRLRVKLKLNNFKNYIVYYKILNYRLYNERERKVLQTKYVYRQQPMGLFKLTFWSVMNYTFLVPSPSPPLVDQSTVGQFVCDSSAPRSLQMDVHCCRSYSQTPDNRKFLWVVTLELSANRVLLLPHSWVYCRRQIDKSISLSSLNSSYIIIETYPYLAKCTKYSTKDWMTRACVEFLGKSGKSIGLRNR